MENTDLLQNGAGGAESTAMSGEEMFQAYQEGKSLEEVQAMYEASVGQTEPAEDGGGDNAGFVTTNSAIERDVDVTSFAPTQRVGGLEPEGEGNPGGEAGAEQPDTDAANGAKSAEGDGSITQPEGGKKPEKPFRIFQTQADFQKVFDKAFGERYGAMRHEMSEQQARMEETKNLLAEVLGVSRENAFEELRKRRYAMEAEQNGYENPEQYAALKQAETQIAELKQAEAARQAQASVAEIRRQGAALTAQVPSFNLDSAMENDMFRQTVFSLHQAGAQDSVERAFKAVFFEDFIKQQSAAQKESEPETAPRPKEGAVAPKTRETVKPVNVAGFTSEQILDIERRILRGEKVTF